MINAVFRVTFFSILYTRHTSSRLGIDFANLADGYS